MEKIIKQGKRREYKEKKNRKTASIKKRIRRNRNINKKRDERYQSACDISVCMFYILECSKKKKKRLPKCKTEGSNNLNENKNFKK